METLHVSRLSARYRLPAGEPDARARLDRVLRDVLAEALDQALARAGVPAHEEVCIRAVHAPARLRLRTGDAELAAAWGVALADGIRATLDAGGPGVVRYGSKSQAVIDLLLGVAVGDLRRAWAWRQMELWSAGDAPSAALAAEEAARTLVSRPESIVAAVSAAARAGALPGLAARIAGPAWSALARAALAAASVADGVAAALLASPAPPPAPSTASSADGTRADPASVAPASPVVVSADAADDVPSPAVGRVLRASHIAAAVASDAAFSADAVFSSDSTAGGSQEAAVRRALAILAVLEAEPSALLRASAVSLVAAVERELARNADARRQTAERAKREIRQDELYRRAARSRTRVDRDSTTTSADGIDRDAASRADGIDRSAVAEPVDRDEPSDRAGEPRPPRRDPLDRPESPDDRRGEARDGDGAAGRTAAGGAADDTAPAGIRDKKDSFAEVDERPLPDVRASAETRWGGLLFLVNLLAELHVAQELLDGFPARPLRWTLHRLALELLALDPGDPAALAFAGLAPDRDPPSAGEPAATDEESAAIAAVAARLTAALHERVAREPAVDARRAAATLREVCRREATVLADPGWIELRMRLDQVSLDVRRAGLDLDPGWVPWLGAVVRFVYE